MKLAILIKNVYGNTLYYPFNDAAKSLAKLTGKKTFSPDDLVVAKKELGFDIEFLDAASMYNPMLSALAA